MNEQMILKVILKITTIITTTIIIIAVPSYVGLTNVMLPINGEYTTTIQLTGGTGTLIPSVTSSTNTNIIPLSNIVFTTTSSSSSRIVTIRARNVVGVSIINFVLQDSTGVNTVTRIEVNVYGWFCLVLFSFVFVFVILMLI